MTVPLCIRQGSKRNDDSVSVEELDWSAESQVLIPAEHLWCDFKCRLEPKINHQAPMTCTYGKVKIQFYVHVSLLPQFGSSFISSKEGGVPVLLSIMNVQVIGVWWWILAQGLHLKSHQRCSAGIRTWLSADQSSSSTLTESSFLFDPCLIHRDTVMLE